MEILKLRISSLRSILNPNTDDPEPDTVSKFFIYNSSRQRNFREGNAKDECWDAVSSM